MSTQPLPDLDTDEVATLDIASRYGGGEGPCPDAVLNAVRKILADRLTAADAPLDTAHYQSDERPLNQPFETTCSNCGCIAADHTPGRFHPYGRCPDGMLRASARERGSSLHYVPLDSFLG